MSELEAREPQPDPMTLVEYQVVRVDGTLLLSVLGMLDSFTWWRPAPGFEIHGPCAGRYRVLLPGGPWIVHTCYPEGFPGPRGAWPEGTQLPGATPALPAAAGTDGSPAP